MIDTKRHIIEDADASLYPCSHFYTNLGPCRNTSVVVYQIGDHGALYGACNLHIERLIVEPEARAMIERCDDCGHRVGEHGPTGCAADDEAAMGGCDCWRTPSDAKRAEGPVVYLVSEGSYSDYHIIAAFSNREAAEQFADEAIGGVEEYVLRDSPPPKATCYYRSLMPREGEGGSIIFETVEREEVHHVGIHRYTALGEVSDEPPAIAYAATHEGMIRRLHSDRSRWPAGMGLWALVQVFGYDRERVEAAYRDRVAEVRARVEGIG